MGGFGTPLKGGQSMNCEETRSSLDGESEIPDSSIWKLISPRVAGVKTQQAKRSISILLSE